MIPMGFLIQGLAEGNREVLEEIAYLPILCGYPSMSGAPSKHSEDCLPRSPR